MSDLEEKPKYPKQIAAILTMIFFEKISLVGFRTVFKTFSMYIMHYDHEDADLLYSWFRSANYSFPILGALFGDCWIGKYKTILIFYIVYIFGTLLLSLSAIGYSENTSLILCVISLLLIALGLGTSKPCVPTFGGDQFKLPEQYKELESFFIFRYMALNLGGAIAVLATPAAASTHCNSKDSCYPLGFGLSTIFVTLALTTFLIATRWYIILKPQENNTIDWITCICNGIRQKIVSKEKVQHWLDYSTELYGDSFVKQTKATIKVIIMFLVLEFFGATIIIVIQSWQMQGHFMRIEVGNNIIIRPIAILFTSYLLVVFVALIICFVVYPLITKCGITVTPLRKIACGGFFGSTAMFVSAILALCIESELPDLPKIGESHLRFYNPLNCPITINVPPFIDNLKIESMDYRFVKLKVEDDKKIAYTITGCENVFPKSSDQIIPIKEKESVGYFFTEKGLKVFKEDLKKHIEGSGKIRSLVGNFKQPDKIIKFVCYDQDLTEIKADDYSVHKITTGFYSIGDIEKAAKFSRGGIYRVLINMENDKVKNVTYYEVGKPHQVSILWQLPQYILHTIAKVLIIPTAFEFAYTQTADSLKCTMLAVYLVTTGFGNHIVAIIELVQIFKHQSAYYFTFGGLTVFFGILFVFLAIRYKYVDPYYGKEEEIIDNKNE